MFYLQICHVLSICMKFIQIKHFNRGKINQSGVINFKLFPYFIATTRRANKINLGSQHLSCCRLWDMASLQNCHECLILKSNFIIVLEQIT